MFLTRLPTMTNFLSLLSLILSFSQNGLSLRYPNVTTKIETLDYSKAPPNDEQRLLRHILRIYDRSVRPVIKAAAVVEVAVGLTLTHIFNIDEKKQVLSMNVWLEQAWIDERLQWHPTQFGNITQLTVPTRFLWTPDIVLYNNAEDFSHGIIQTNVNVYPDGSVLWAPPIKSHSTCKLDVSYFPFDEQICYLRFGSWIYDARQVDVTNRSSNISIDRKEDGSYIENGEWEVVETVVERNTHHYPFSQLYSDVTFTLHLRRRTLYYAYNIIIPCVMLSVLTVMQFSLPTESGEKVTLGLTMLLAYSVFSFNIGEKMPETSDVIPLIAIYIMCVMGISSVSVIFSVMVLNVRHGGECKRGVPKWLRFLAFRILAPLVCYKTDEYGLKKLIATQVKFQKAFVSMADSSKLSTGPAIDVEGRLTGSMPQSRISSNRQCAKLETISKILVRINKLTSKMEDDFKSEEFFAEWRKVSHIFDMFFFGLIVFITFGVTMAMLVLAPTLSKLDLAQYKTRIVAQ